MRGSADILYRSMYREIGQMLRGGYTVHLMSLHSQAFDNFLLRLFAPSVHSLNSATKLCAVFGDDYQLRSRVSIAIGQFLTESMCEKGISLPRQHDLVHYHAFIQLFGASNALCTSLSASKHKDFTKGVWRRSNRNNPFGRGYTVHLMYQRSVNER